MFKEEESAAIDRYLEEVVKLMDHRKPGEFWRIVNRVRKDNNQSRTNGPINAHLNIAQVMPRYNHKKMKNKKHCCKSFVKISAVAQQ